MAALVQRAALGLLLLTVGCGGSLTDTAVVGPSAPRCVATVTPSAATFPHGGAAGTLSVAASRECQWTASADAAWITLAPDSGQGDATIRLGITANPAGSSRTAAVAVHDQRIELSQEGAPCRLQLSGPGAPVPAAGGELELELSSPDGCAWQAASDVPWVSIARNTAGSGSATIGIRISANPGLERRAVVTAGDASFRLVQTGAAPQSPAPPSPEPPPPPAPAPAPPSSPAPPCTVGLSRTTQSFNAAGGTGDVRVRTDPACAWIATSSAAWIVIERGSSGTGNDEVRYRVAPNGSTEPRTGTLTIAGQTLLVQQDGAAPPKPQKVEVDGPVTAVSGSCPGLAMTVKATAVTTDGSTRFKKGSCGDIQNGVNVKVKGERTGSAPVRASEVEVDQRDR